MTATRSFTVNPELGTLPDAPHRRRYTSPLGRIVDENVDARGRLRQRKVGRLEPLRLEHDARGHLAFVRQGAGAAERVTSLTYNAITGFLDQLVDPLGRVLQVTGRDAGGRVTEVILPGNRTVGFVFDPSGNLTSLTPPGRPAHGFAYTAVDQEQLYTPPEVVVGEPRAVSRTYNTDRQLDLVTRPDAESTIDPAYEATTGRLDTLAIPQGVLDYGYHPTTGHVASIQAPGGVGLAFTHDGPLLTSATWSGPVAGSVAYTHEEMRPKTETVTGDGASFVTWAYDDDGLLESASRPGSPMLALPHHPDHGLPTGATLNVGSFSCVSWLGSDK